MAASCSPMWPTATAASTSSLSACPTASGASSRSTEDKVVLATFGDDQALYLLSRRGAPHGRVLRVALGKQPPRLTAATLVVPEANDAVVAFDPTGADTVVASGGRLYIIDIVGGPNQVRVYSRDGRPLGSLPVPAS